MNAITVEELTKIQQAEIESANLANDWHMWDIRFAETLNRFATAMRHGGRTDYTDADARRIREAVIASEATVAGIDGDVSSGFGQPVRMQENEAVKRLLERIVEANKTLLRKAADDIDATMTAKAQEVASAADSVIMNAQGQVIS